MNSEKYLTVVSDKLRCWSCTSCEDMVICRLAARSGCWNVSDRLKFAFFFLITRPLAKEHLSVPPDNLFMNSTEICSYRPQTPRQLEQRVLTTFETLIAKASWFLIRRLASAHQGIVTNSNCLPNDFFLIRLKSRVYFVTFCFAPSFYPELFKQISTQGIFYIQLVWPTLSPNGGDILAVSVYGKKNKE